jgi:hypothetical protein
VETAEETADLVSSVLLDAGAGGVEITGDSALPAAHRRIPAQHTFVGQRYG